MFGVGEAAELLGAKPRDITSLFYDKKLRCDLCPLVSARRVIPATYLHNIAMELRRNGKTVNFDGIVNGGDK